MRESGANNPANDALIHEQSCIMHAHTNHFKRRRSVITRKTTETQAPYIIYHAAATAACCCPRILFVEKPKHEERQRGKSLPGLGGSYLCITGQGRVPLNLTFCTNRSSSKPPPTAHHTQHVPPPPNNTERERRKQQRATICAPSREIIDELVMNANLDSHACIRRHDEHSFPNFAG